MMCKIKSFSVNWNSVIYCFFKPITKKLEDSRSVEIKVVCSLMYGKKILMCEFSSSSLFLILKHFYLLYFPPTNAIYSSLNSTKMIEQLTLAHVYTPFSRRAVLCEWVWRAGRLPHRFPQNNFSSVYWIFTILGHTIPLLKGKNTVYFRVIRSRSPLL